MRKIGNMLLSLVIYAGLLAGIIILSNVQITSAQEIAYQLGTKVTGMTSDIDYSEYYFELSYPISIRFELSAEDKVTLWICNENEEVFALEGVTKVNETRVLPKGKYCVCVWEYTEYDDIYLVSDQAEGFSYTLKMSDVTSYAKNISLSDSKCNLAVGGTKTLKTVTTPIGATVKGITWSSSNKSVATVNSKGKITAKGLGKATISASLTGGNTAKCEVTVNSADYYTTVNGKTTVKLNGITGAKWTSGNKKIATVNSSGLVTGKSGGKVTITAQKSGINYKCNFVVTNYKTLAKAVFKKLKSEVQYPSSIVVSQVYYGYLTSNNAPVAVIEYKAKNSRGVMTKGYTYGCYDKKYKMQWENCSDLSKFKSLKKQNVNVIK